MNNYIAFMRTFEKQALEFGIKFEHKDLDVLYNLVDCSNPNLTEEQKEIIINICRKDADFFYYKVLNIPIPLDEGNSFIPNNLRINLLTALHQGNNCLVNAIRQHPGKTTTILSYILYNRLFSDYIFDVNIFENTVQDFNSIKSKLTEMYNLLPEYFQKIKSIKNILSGIKYKSKDPCRLIWFDNYNNNTSAINIHELASSQLIVTDTKVRSNLLTTFIKKNYTIIPYSPMILNINIKKAILESFVNEKILLLEFNYGYNKLNIPDNTIERDFININADIKSFMNEYTIN